jgi:dTDP-L-rhamnose 4-epimerase
MRILITGGVGFIGSHLAESLTADGHRVVVFDIFDPQVHVDGKSRVPGGATLRLGDVRNADALARVAREADAIFHFAAAVGVGQSQYQIRHYVETNVAGTATLLEILSARRKRPKKLIIAGSMSAYGEGAYNCARCGRVRPTLRVSPRRSWEPLCPGCSGAISPMPTQEDDRFICNSVYAVTKMAQEELSMNFGAAYGVPTTTLRFFNVYGPRQSLFNPYTGVAAIFISRAKNDKPPVVYEDGLQTRDFISIRDIVQSCRLALVKKQADFEVFNVGTGRATSVLELAGRVLRAMGSRLEPNVLGRFRSGDIRHCFPDIEKIKSRLGFRPKVPLDVGLAELVAWSRDVKAIDRFDRAQKELSSRRLV